VYLINEIARDGKVNWLEGLQLLALYVGLAVLFFFYQG
jgi:Ca2+/H+ antiporter